MSGFTHFDDNGNAHMVDVSDKEITTREAVAVGTITLSPRAIALVLEGKMKKGDVLGVAQIAGIMGAKKTSELIPLCHPLSLSKITIEFQMDEGNNRIHTVVTVKTDGKTGVEMEALTGVNIALLTIYDMCKSVDKAMVISNVHLRSKTGGKSGDFTFD